MAQASTSKGHAASSANHAMPDLLKLLQSIRPVRLNDLAVALNTTMGLDTVGALMDAAASKPEQLCQLALGLADHSSQPVDPPPDPAAGDHTTEASAMLKVGQKPLVSPFDRGALGRGPVLGSGKFSDVLVGQRPSGPCAVKMIMVGEQPTHQHGSFPATMAAVEEAKTLLKLSHPNIVRCLDVFAHQDLVSPTSVGNYVCIALEFCDLGTLADVAFENTLALGDVLDITRQICLGLRFLHQDQHTVHCDVKLENVFIKSGLPSARRDTVLVGDFGHAASLGRCRHFAVSASSGGGIAGPSNTTAWLNDACRGTWCTDGVRHGTLSYAAPECFDEGQHLRQGHDGITAAVDAWSLGCLLFELVTTECLPLGAGPSILGRQAAVLGKAGWGVHRETFLDSFRSSVMTMANSDTSAGTDVQEQANDLALLLVMLWTRSPEARPQVHDILAAPHLDGSRFFFVCPNRASATARGAAAAPGATPTPVTQRVATGAGAVAPPSTTLVRNHSLELPPPTEQNKQNQ
eukprot:m.56356 g.56356  ORF g.56356 m.56356 type:complete len:520 (-) comp12604_c0_seq1:46-1605(-)